jgi:predicted N-acetyltransferase YhbS
VKIEYLADHKAWVHVLAFMHQLEMRTPNERDFRSSVERFSERTNRDTLPIALVVIEDTIPVGSVSLLEFQLTSYRQLTPWVAGLFVLEQYRGQGIAHRLMQEMESIALSMGHRTLHLFTHTAEKYYESRGWEPIGTVEPPEVRYPSIVMSKELQLGKSSLADSVPIPCEPSVKVDYEALDW